MFKEERCKEILNLIREHGFLTVEFLSQKLHYSPATIRRDLVYLAQMGAVEKSYGGVSPAELDMRHALPYELRKKSSSAEKKRIAALAAGMIEENQVVFIDGSTTASGIIDYINPNKNVTVITNNLENCIKLQHKNIRGFCTGGEISPQTPSLQGKIACDMLSQINIDIMFFASKSLSSDGVISEYSESILMPVKAAMKNSSRIIYLTDSNKVGTVSMFNICTIDDVDAIICEKDISDKLTDNCDKTKIIY